MPTTEPADDLRSATACLLRPSRLPALRRLAAYPSEPARLATAIDCTLMEITVVLADLLRHGLVFERGDAYHASAFGHTASAFARSCRAQAAAAPGGTP